MFIINIIDWLTSLFSGTNFDSFFDFSWVTEFQHIISFIAWVLPLDTILFVFSFSISLIGIRILVAIYKLIPFT